MFELYFYREDCNTLHNGLYHTAEEAIAALDELFKEYPTGTGTVTDWSQKPVKIIHSVY
jgi:hypothetical protein